MNSVVNNIPVNSQDLLCQLLTLNQFSITRLANELNVSKASISRLVNGVVKKPQHKTYEKLLSLYCSVFYSAHDE